ncbi:hypothetical protein [Phenylobacterium sp.]|uniref:hypothetical protein n=1 Tax=Phenylobacterium sp. TaxID=1871053 RepID=UPI003BAAA7E3
MFEVRRFPGNRAIVLPNVNCPYCGRLFGGDVAKSREHVVGRRFVPLRCLDAQWNLILTACTVCNSEKADLEDDISAITMQPNCFGQYAVDDPRLKESAELKAARSRSRKTGRLVGESHVKLHVTELPGVPGGRVVFEAPPQIDEHRIWRLAHFHVRGFFFFDTFAGGSRRGGFPLGDFCPVLTVRRDDWGNARIRSFTSLVANWDLRIHAIGADGFFKIMIRRHPEDRLVWCWALEWNQNQRVVGFMGDRQEIARIAKQLAVPDVYAVSEGSAGQRWFRPEAPLPESEDTLFRPDPVAADILIDRWRPDPGPETTPT